MQHSIGIEPCSFSYNLSPLVHNTMTIIYTTSTKTDLLGTYLSCMCKEAECGWDVYKKMIKLHCCSTSMHTSVDRAWIIHHCQSALAYT